MQSTEKRPKLGAPRRNTIDTFWEKVTPAGACWTWEGTVGPEGYALYWLDGQSRPVHRIAYEFLTGETIPDGFHLDHLCRTRHCVNPDHLEPVTPRENSRRANEPKIGRTHCVNGHEWTPENTLAANSSRRCRQCVLVRQHVQAGLDCSYSAPCTETVHARGKGEPAAYCMKGHSMEDAYVRGNGDRMCSTCIAERAKGSWAEMPKVTCECGAVVAKCNLKAHTKTEKHALKCRNET